MKKILLLGASGSIGKQTIDVINNHPDELKLVGASVGKNIDYLKELLDKYNLEYAYSIEKDDELAKKYPNTRFYFGDEGIKEIVKETSYDTLVNALVGYVGFEPTLNAINSKKDIALANKETLIVGGDIINKAIKDNNVNLYPIDSEHSAIFQCLQGNKKEEVRRLIVTASGGSFRDKTREELKDVSVEDALKHPNWNMGKKITVDCATMVNKGLEVMEAHYLFDCDYDDIKTIIHRESIVHSMVEYRDGSVMACLSIPDMRGPISYAMSYPNKESYSFISSLDLTKIAKLSFEEMNMSRFPMLDLAYKVGKMGGIMPTVYNSSNEVATSLFINRKIKFLEIENIIYESVNEYMDEYNKHLPLTLDYILDIDKKVRESIRNKFN